MEAAELRSQVDFGLENLDKIFQNIQRFSKDEIAQDLKVSALAYECLGYYNAIEHLMIRFLKFSKSEIPTGAFSHRDTIKMFYTTFAEMRIGLEVVKAIDDLMGFRHVVTKIYGFLLDWDRLRRVVDQIAKFHTDFKQIFLDAIEIATKSGH